MEIAIGIIGLLIAWLTYQKTFHAEPKEEIENFTIQFKSTQSMSKKVQSRLIEFADEFDGWEAEVSSGVTLAKYIVTMQQVYDRNLSDDLFKKILEAKPNKLTLASMTKSLETQLAELIRMDAYVDMHLKKTI